MGLWEVIGLAKSRRDVWSDAIEKAERDLAHVEKKLVGWQALMQRRELLRATIENLKTLRGRVPSSTESGPKGESLVPRMLLWQQVYEVLKAAGKPQSPVEIMAALNITGRNGREMIRQALNRKGKIFERLVDGRYGLVEWQRGQGRLLPASMESGQ